MRWTTLKMLLDGEAEIKLISHRDTGSIKRGDCVVCKVVDKDDGEYEESFFVIRHFRDEGSEVEELDAEEFATLLVKLEPDEIGSGDKHDLLEQLSSEAQGAYFEAYLAELRKGSDDVRVIRIEYSGGICEGEHIYMLAQRHGKVEVHRASTCGSTFVSSQGCGHDIFIADTFDSWQDAIALIDEWESPDSIAWIDGQEVPQDEDQDEDKEPTWAEVRKFLLSWA